MAAAHEEYGNSLETGSESINGENAFVHVFGDYSGKRGKETKKKDLIRM